MVGNGGRRSCIVEDLVCVARIWKMRPTLTASGLKAGLVLQTLFGKPWLSSREAQLVRHSLQCS